METREKGTLRDSDHLRREGMPEWSTVGTVFGPSGELKQLTVADATSRSEPGPWEWSSASPTDVVATVTAFGDAVGQQASSPVAPPHPSAASGVIDTPVRDLFTRFASTHGQPESTGNIKDVRKRQYIDAIRTNTAYPTYLETIGVFPLLGYALAALNGFIALIASLSGTDISFFGVQFWKKAALILADIGDSVTEANSRNERPGWAAAPDPLRKTIPPPLVAAPASGQEARRSARFWSAAVLRHFESAHPHRQWQTRNGLGGGRLNHSGKGKMVSLPKAAEDRRTP